LAEPATFGPGIRHAWLTDVIRQVHAASRQTYRSRLAHADQDTSGADRP
jgi:hypothetical protein